MDVSDSEQETHPVVRDDGDTVLARKRQTPVLSDADFLRMAYGDDVVIAPDCPDTLLISGVKIPKKRPLGRSEDEMDACYDKMHEHILKAAKRIFEKDQLINAVRRALGSNGDQTGNPIATSGTSCIDIDGADADSVAKNAHFPSPQAQNGRLLFTIGADHRHALLGKVRLHCASWAENVQIGGDVRIVTRKKSHSGFPHVVRIGRSGAMESYVERGRSFDVCAEIRYLLGGVFTDSTELLNHANEWKPSGTDSAFRFQMHLIYAWGDGWNGDCEKPFASTDERSHFRPGTCLGKANNGAMYTNLFTKVNPNTNEVFYGTCTQGKVVFKNVTFRPDALSSNVLIGDGSFRFVIRATHPALRGIANYTALSEKFYVGARVRSTTADKKQPAVTDDKTAADDG